MYETAKSGGNALNQNQPDPTMKPADTSGRLRYEIREKLNSERLSGRRLTDAELEAVLEAL